jgi:hypothetical protein
MKRDRVNPPTETKTENEQTDNQWGSNVRVLPTASAMLKSRSKKRKKSTMKVDEGGNLESTRATKIDMYPCYPERRNNQSHVAPCVMRDTLYLFESFP